MRAILASLTLLGSVITVQPTFAEAVDLALVLAADVSASVDQQGFELQRQGYAAAVNDPTSAGCDSIRDA